MVHRQRYAVVTSRETVIDLLALDEMNPRSVRFQLDNLRARLDDLASLRAGGGMLEVERRVLALQTALTVHSVDSLDTEALEAVHAGLLDLSPALNAAYIH